MRRVLTAATADQKRKKFNMMRRFLSNKKNTLVVLILVFTLALTGCGKDEKDDSKKDTATTAQTVVTSEEGTTTETAAGTTEVTSDEKTTAEATEDKTEKTTAESTEDKTEKTTAESTEDKTEKTTAESTEDKTEKTEASSDSNIADSSEMVEAEDVTDENMTPITPDMVLVGEYDIDVLSSSSMFKIVSTKLAVKDGKFTVTMTMGGKGYLYVYPGTPEEAAAADESAYIPFVEDEEGNHTFTFEIPSLDTEIKCAAFSKKKEKWYDRSLCFLSSKLTRGDYNEGFLITPGKLILNDGIYSADVNITGGSGRAGIESPAKLEIKDGEIFATIVWNSSNYDYMIVGGEKYEAEIVDDHSTFTIPVIAFDYRQVVTADTTAMSKPHEIEYSLRFDSKSIKPAE